MKLKRRSKIILSYIHRLLNLAESKEDYNSEVELPQLGLLDIIQNFDSINITMDALFQISSRIMVSYFIVYLMQP